MAYLQRDDYKKLIQADNLNQITNSDATILSGIELMAQAEAISYLSQKYITAQEFADLLTWSPVVAYKANQRVTLDATAYNASGTYAVNDLTSYGGKIYICIIAITVPEAFTLAKWTLLGLQFAIFYVTLPKPLFNLTGVYAIGDMVFWNDKIYTCRIASGTITQDTALQYGLYGNIPPTNIFPDDRINGVRFWGDGTAYSVATGTLPTDTAKWTAGDNRNQQLVNYMVDIALYHVHSRISPRNIPDLRVKRYDDAIKWLKMAGRGDITADLPLIQPKQGNRIRWGGRVKNINSY